jgi:hypothetical protein
MKKTVLFAFAVITFATPMLAFAGERVTTVPEPATGLLLLLGGAGAAAYRKMRQRRG